jgi:hypothetical protein
MLTVLRVILFLRSHEFYVLAHQVDRIHTSSVDIPRPSRVLLDAAVRNVTCRVRESSLEVIVYNDFSHLTCYRGQAKGLRP